MKAYKGTDLDGKCRGFQYEVGKEYETDKDISLCSHGFHACENPVDVFGYYNPANSRFFEVEQEGRIKKGDDKSVSSKIKIKAEIKLHDLVTAGVSTSRPVHVTEISIPTRDTIHTIP